MDSFITIKSITTKMFEVELLQDEHGRYVIRYCTPVREGYSEYITDYMTASYLFDLKIKDLEGH